MTEQLQVQTQADVTSVDVELSPADILCKQASDDFKKGSYYVAVRNTRIAKRMGSIEAIELLAKAYDPSSGISEKIMRGNVRKPLTPKYRRDISDRLFESAFKARMKRLGL